MVFIDATTTSKIVEKLIDGYDDVLQWIKDVSKVGRE